jgi:hypothetical protein
MNERDLDAMWRIQKIQDALRPAGRQLSGHRER